MIIQMSFLRKCLKKQNEESVVRMDCHRKTMQVKKQNAHVLDNACKGINQSGCNLDCNVNGNVQEECLDISTMPQLVEQLKIETTLKSA